jgi:rubrerythrin
MADSHDSLEVLRNAILMELEGQEFFKKAAERMNHPRAKQTFLSLVKQEQRHVDVLSSEFSRISDGLEWSSLTEAMAAGAPARLSVFRDRGILQAIKVREDAGELEVLKIGIEVEQKSIDYYRAAGTESADPKAREVYFWLVGEEAGHLTILNAEYDNRTRSGYYYDQAEFSLEVMLRIRAYRI